MENERYAALIVDLKGSRKYSAELRREIQEYISHTVRVLNGIFSEEFEREVAFSAGDEIQGLFSRGEGAYLYFRLLFILLYPIEIRGGIGVGEWNVRMANAPTTAQDGEAYHKARYAIHSTDTSLGYSVLYCSDSEKDQAVNSLLNAEFSILSKQSEAQNELMLLSEILSPIIGDKVIAPEKLPEVTCLAEERERLCSLIYNEQNKKIPAQAAKLSAHCVLRREIIPEGVSATESDSFFTLSGKVRGLPVRLAEILGVTRQSVDKGIKSGGIYEARNLAVTTLCFLGNRG